MSENSSPISGFPSGQERFRDSETQRSGRPLGETNARRVSEGLATDDDLDLTADLDLAFDGAEDILRT